MATLFKDLARSYGRAGIIAVISTVVGLPVGCVYVLVPLGFMAAVDYAGWAIAVSAVLYLVPLVVVTVGVPLAAALHRKAKLDALFVPLGVTGGAYQTHFRQYHGLVQGRQVDVYFYRGPVLEIEVATPLLTRLGVARQEAGMGLLAGMVGRQALALDDSALSDLSVYVIDESWSRALLDLPAAGEVLHRLTEPSGDFTRQQVILRPGAFKLMLTGNRRMFGFDLASESVGRWLEDLIQLAVLAEGLPGPTTLADLTSTEQFALRLRQRNPFLALWIGLVVLGFFVILSVVVALIIVLISHFGGL